MSISNKDQSRKKLTKMHGEFHYKEKTLAEIGFNNTDITNWEHKNQPVKPDLFDLINKMITNYEKTSVKIKIDETIFNCHMIVLQCYSDYFADKTLEQIVELPSDKVSLNAFIMVYNWMLAPKPAVQREGILELFNAAQFLRIRPLVQQCWTCLDDEEIFTEDSAFILYLESRVFGHELLQQLMLTRVCKFFLTLVSSKDFLELSKNEVCTLLQSNCIGVNSETDVLMSAIRWLEYDWGSREKSMLDVIKCVRFGLMAPWQLVELGREAVSPEILKIVQNLEVRKMIEDGLSFVTTKHFRSGSVDEFAHTMEQLKLTEPIDRQWICDNISSANSLHELIPMLNAYNLFLKYLDLIRSMGREHWRSLQFYEGDPNKFSISRETPKYQPKLSRFAFKDQLDWKENKTSASLINCKENKHKLIIINGSKYTLPHESMVDRELNASNVEFENSKILYSEKQSIVQIDDISNYFEEINYLLPHVKENLKNLQIKSSCYCKRINPSSDKLIQTD